jgi:hypothetical protein
LRSGADRREPVDLPDQGVSVAGGLGDPAAGIPALA